MSKSQELERKVGRLITGRIAGTVASQEELEALERGIISGITLFKDNASGLAQLIALIGSIHEAYDGTAFVAVDQEGGAVQRFDHILTPLPSAMALGAMDNWDMVAAVARINARESKLLGINCLLAPVLDLCTEPLSPIIGTRAFGDNPQRVRLWGETVARVTAEEGVLPVGKHFPGHGDTREDSHSRLAVSKADAKVLWQRELIPYKSCGGYMPAVLVGHIWNESIDKEALPGSLSPRVTSGLLRQYLGFDGLVMTDDMLMKAITDGWGLGEAAVLSILAGVDLLLVCGTMQQISEVHSALMEAVSTGRISEDRLDESIARIERALAMTVNSGERGDPAEVLEKLREVMPEDYDTAFGASASAITLLRGRIPDNFNGDWMIIVPDHPRYPMLLAERLKEAFGKSEQHKGAQVLQWRYPINPDGDACRKAVDFCRGRNCIFVSYRALLNEGQQQMARELSRVADARLHVSVDTPYDFLAFPDWENSLSTYDPSDLALEALAAVLSGSREPRGLCPVNLHVSV